MTWCITCKALKPSKKIRASFREPNGTTPTHCGKHKTESMVSIDDRFCQECYEQHGRRVTASYGYLENKRRITCAKHKQDGMVDLSNHKRMCPDCLKNGVERVSTYGLPNKKPTKCLEHKTKEMVVVTAADWCVKCLEDNKTKRGNYGFMGEGITRCSKHKLEKMVDLGHFNQRCKGTETELCKFAASFGFKGKKPEYCKKHKSPEMVILTFRYLCNDCLEEDIETAACYGILGGKRTHCARHKTDEMVDLINRKYMCPECPNDVRSNYGFPGERPIKCVKHKEEGMVYISRHNCIECEDNDKTTPATYGKLFEPKTHCSIHALPNEMRDNNPKCEQCTEQPFYGIEKRDIIPKRCEQHKLENDIDMVSRECETCMLDVFIPSNQTKCARCLEWVTGQNRNRKENLIKVCLEKLSNVTGLSVPIHDKIVQEGCSKKRPDFFYKDFKDTFSLIVEVDEHQHSRYSCSIEGELRRMINIAEQDLGGSPVVFIRFNPDPYYKDDKVIKSYEGRENTLQEVIKGLMNRDTVDHMINVIYLYYDNFITPKIEPLKHRISRGKILVNHHHPLARSPIHELVFTQNQWIPI